MAFTIRSHSAEGAIKRLNCARYREIKKADVAAVIYSPCVRNRKFLEELLKKLKCDAAKVCSALELIR
ncbi:MAG: hypothetical protein ABI612_24710 [Betaproteobacteria bacterium]